jgi:hypothetical protein
MDSRTRSARYRLEVIRALLRAFTIALTTRVANFSSP